MYNVYDLINIIAMSIASYGDVDVNNVDEAVQNVIQIIQQWDYG